MELRRRTRNKLDVLEGDCARAAGTRAHAHRIASRGARRVLVWPRLGARAMAQQRAAAAGRHRALAAVCMTTVLALSSWFTAGAVLPSLRDKYGVTESEGSWLVAAVAAGFVLAASVASVTGLGTSQSGHHKVHCAWCTL